MITSVKSTRVKHHNSPSVDFLLIHEEGLEGRGGLLAGGHPSLVLVSQPRPTSARVGLACETNLVPRLSPTKSLGTRLGDTRDLM